MLYGLRLLLTYRIYDDNVKDWAKLTGTYASIFADNECQTCDVSHLERGLYVGVDPSAKARIIISNFT